MLGRAGVLRLFRWAVPDITRTKYHQSDPVTGKRPPPFLHQVPVGWPVAACPALVIPLLDRTQTTIHTGLVFV